MPNQPGAPNQPLRPPPLPRRARRAGHPRLSVGGTVPAQTLVHLGTLRGLAEEEAVCIAFHARGLPLTLWGEPGELRVPRERLEEARVLLGIVRWEIQARARRAGR
ncbi:MAG: hypothetical protein P1V51_08695 [Deltaproteobacteria bacterium]|nr:hypothetical protein [Deltaproteobacteria bacterium]